MYTLIKGPFSDTGVTTELYYISGDRALIPRQSKKCPQKHGGFWPKIRHFDVIIIPIFMVQTTDTQNCSEMRRKQNILTPLAILKCLKIVLLVRKYIFVKSKKQIKQVNLNMLNSCFVFCCWDLEERKDLSLHR